MAQVHWHQTSLVDLETKSAPRKKSDEIWPRGSCRLTSHCKDNLVKTTGCLPFRCSVYDQCDWRSSKLQLFFKRFLPFTCRRHGGIVCCCKVSRQAMMQGAFQALEQLHQGVEPAVESLGSLRELQVQHPQYSCHRLGPKALFFFILNARM